MVQNITCVPAADLSKYYKNKVTNHERKLDEKVFANAEKLVKKDRVRNSDYGYVAAQTCMLRDFVNADVDEARLLAAKMTFVHDMMNDNLKADASRDCEKIRVNGEQIPAKTELSKARSEGLSSVIKSSGEVIKSVRQPLNCVA